MNIMAVLTTDHRNVDALFTEFQQTDADDVENLARLLDHCGIDAVDLLKLDIEGAELDVLGDEAGLSRVNAIVGEVHYDLGGFTEEQLMARLDGFDARVVAHSPDRALLLARRVERGAIDDGNAGPAPA